MAENGLITVLADGNFDGLHFGHIEHLRMARGLGARLVVALATDENVAGRKGPGRPRFPVAKRRVMLEALRFVDEVIVTDDSLELVAGLRPAIYVKGKEYEGGVDHAEHQKMVQLVESYGGQVVYTDSMLSSSTELLNSNVPFLGAVQKAFIDSVKAKYSLGAINGWLDKFQGLQALVIGEPIKDVYQRVEPLGKSPKDSLVTWKPLGVEEWDGGAIIVAKHLKGLGLEAILDFGDIGPIVKRRFVWGPGSVKVFATVENEDRVVPMRKCLFPARSLNVILDFGHGLIRNGMATMLVKSKDEFVALTCQSNSSNWGFNLLSKYPRADYVVADEAEIRLASHDRTFDLEYLVEEQARRMGTRMLAVTQGHEGCVVYDGNSFVYAPALAPKVVDTLGAGDAFLAATAPLAYLGAPADIVALIGNLAGAIEVSALGQKVLDIATLRKWLKGMA